MKNQQERKQHKNCLYNFCKLKVKFKTLLGFLPAAILIVFSGMLSGCTENGCLNADEDGSLISSREESVYPIDESAIIDFADEDVMSMENILGGTDAASKLSASYILKSDMTNTSAKSKIWKPFQINDKLYSSKNGEDFFVYKGFRVQAIASGSVVLNGLSSNASVKMDPRLVGLSPVTYTNNLVNAGIRVKGGESLKISRVSTLNPNGDPVSVKGKKLHFKKGLFIVFKKTDQDVPTKYHKQDNWACQLGVAGYADSTGSEDNLTGCATDMRNSGTDKSDFTCGPINSKTSRCAGWDYDNLEEKGKIEGETNYINDRANSKRQRYLFAMEEKKMFKHDDYLCRDNSIGRKGVYRFGHETSSKMQRQCYGTGIPSCILKYMTPMINLKNFAICTYNYLLKGWATSKSATKAEFGDESALSGMFFSPNETCDSIITKHKMRDVGQIYGGLVNFGLFGSTTFWGSEDSTSPMLISCKKSVCGEIVSKYNHTHKSIQSTTCGLDWIKTIYPAQTISFAHIGNVRGDDHFGEAKVRVFVDNKSLPSTESSIAIQNSTAKSVSLSTAGHEWEYPQYGLLGANQTIHFKAYGAQSYSDAFIYRGSVNTKYASSMYLRNGGDRDPGTAVAFKVNPISFVGCFDGWTEICSNPRIQDAQQCKIKETIASKEYQVGRCTKQVDQSSIIQKYSGSETKGTGTLVSSGSIFDPEENVLSDHCGICIDLSKTKINGSIYSLDSKDIDKTSSKSVGYSTCIGDKIFLTSYLDVSNKTFVKYRFEQNMKNSWCNDVNMPHRSNGLAHSYSSVYNNNKLPDGSYYGYIDGYSVSSITVPKDLGVADVFIGIAGEGDDIYSLYGSNDSKDNSFKTSFSSGSELSAQNGYSLTLSTGDEVKNGKYLFFYVQEFKKDANGDYINDELDENKHPDVVFSEGLTYDDIYQMWKNKAQPIYNFYNMTLGTPGQKKQANWESSHSGKVWAAILDFSPVASEGFIESDGKNIVFIGNETRSNDTLSNVISWNSGKYRVKLRAELGSNEDLVSKYSKIFSLLDYMLVDVLIRGIFFGPISKDNQVCRTYVSTLRHDNAVISVDSLGSNLEAHKDYQTQPEYTKCSLDGKMLPEKSNIVFKNGYDPTGKTININCDSKNYVGICSKQTTQVIDLGLNDKLKLGVVYLSSIMYRWNDSFFTGNAAGQTSSGSSSAAGSSPQPISLDDIFDISTEKAKKRFAMIATGMSLFVNYFGPNSQKGFWSVESFNKKWATYFTERKQGLKQYSQSASSSSNFLGTLSLSGFENQSFCKNTAPSAILKYEDISKLSDAQKKCLLTEMIAGFFVLERVIPKTIAPVLSLQPTSGSAILNQVYLNSEDKASIDLGSVKINTYEGKYSAIKITPTTCTIQRCQNGTCPDSASIIDYGCSSDSKTCKSLSKVIGTQSSNICDPIMIADAGDPLFMFESNISKDVQDAADKIFKDWTDLFEDAKVSAPNVDPEAEYKKAVSVYEKNRNNRIEEVKNYACPDGFEIINNLLTICNDIEGDNICVFNGCSKIVQMYIEATFDKSYSKPQRLVVPKTQNEYDRLMADYKTKKTNYNTELKTYQSKLKTWESNPIHKLGEEFFISSIYEFKYRKPRPYEPIPPYPPYPVAKSSSGSGATIAALDALVDRKISLTLNPSYVEEPNQSSTCSDSWRVGFVENMGNDIINLFKNDAFRVKASQIATPSQFCFAVDKTTKQVVSQYTTKIEVYRYCECASRSDNTKTCKIKKLKTDSDIACLTLDCGNSLCWEDADTSIQDKFKTIPSPSQYIVDNDIVEDASKIAPSCQTSASGKYKLYSNCSLDKQTRVKMCDIARYCTPGFSDGQVLRSQVPVYINSGMQTAGETKIDSVSGCEKIYHEREIYECSDGGEKKICEKINKYDCKIASMPVLNGAQMSSANAASVGCLTDDNYKFYCATDVFDSVKDGNNFTKNGISGTLNHNQQISICNSTPLSSDITKHSIGWADSELYKNQKAGSLLGQRCFVSKSCTYEEQVGAATSTKKRNANDIIGGANKIGITQVITSKDKGSFIAYERCTTGRSWESGVIYFVYNLITSSAIFHTMYYLTVVAGSIFYFAMVLIGRQNPGIEPGIKKIAKFSIVAIILSPKGWDLYKYFILDNVINMSDGLVDLVVNAANAGQRDVSKFGPVDNVIKTTFLSPVFWYRLTAILMENAYGWIYVILILFALISYIIIAFGALIEYIGHVLMIILALSVGVIPIALFVFDQTKNMFNQWKNTIIENIASQMYLFLVVSFFSMFFIQIIKTILHFKICWNPLIRIGNITILGWWTLPESIGASLAALVPGLSSGNENTFPSFLKIILLLFIVAMMRKFLENRLLTSGSMTAGAAKGIMSKVDGVRSGMVNTTFNAAKRVASTVPFVSGFAEGGLSVAQNTLNGNASGKVTTSAQARNAAVDRRLQERKKLDSSAQKSKSQGKGERTETKNKITEQRSDSKKRMEDEEFVSNRIGSFANELESGSVSLGDSGKFNTIHQNIADAIQRDYKGIGAEDAKNQAALAMISDVAQRRGFYESASPEDVQKRMDQDVTKSALDAAQQRVKGKTVKEIWENRISVDDDTGKVISSDETKSTEGEE